MDRGLAIDWADLMGHKRGFTDPVPDNLQQQLAGKGGRHLPRHRNPRRRGPPRGRRHPVCVPACAGRHRRAAPLAGRPGAQHLIDSTDFLELSELPERVVFVGGGFISFEFAHIAARAGSRPVIVHRGDRPLKRFDPDLVDLPVTRSAEVGINTHTGTSVSPHDHRTHRDRQRQTTSAGAATVAILDGDVQRDTIHLG